MISQDADATNPYTPPASRLETETEDFAGYALAGRGARLGAFLIDDIAVSALSLLLLWGTIVALGYSFSLFETTDNDPSELLVSMLAVCFNAGVFLAVNGYLLVTQGQTIGKFICRIRIVRQDDQRASLWDTCLKRYLPLLLLRQIPYLGTLLMLVDPLFIFGEDRLCLHDHLAGTKVIGTTPVEDQARDSRPDAWQDRRAEVPRSSPETFCPYCVTKVLQSARTCPDCKRTIFMVDGSSANQELSQTELLRKVYRLEARGLAQEAHEVLLFVVRKHPDCRAAWTSLREMPQSSQAVRVEAEENLKRLLTPSREVPCA